MKPKISLIGYSGVGKSTIFNLIRTIEIPVISEPLKNEDIASIKMGNFCFYIWDYKGKENFKFLWEDFIKSSDIIFLITDSTLENAENSKFFIEIIKDQAPKAQIMVFANKQDLPGAMKPNEIEKILRLKTIPISAIDPSVRDKIIQLIAELLGLSQQLNENLELIKKKDQLESQFDDAMNKENFGEALYMAENLIGICIKLENSQLKEKYEQLKLQLLTKIKNNVNSISQTKHPQSILTKQNFHEQESKSHFLLKKLIRNYLYDVEDFIMMVVSDHEGNTIVSLNKDNNKDLPEIDEKVFEIAESEFIMDKSSAFSVQVICPVCTRKKKITVPKKLVEESNNIVTLSISTGIVCEHNFQVYMDKNLAIRGYQRVDYEYDRYIDKIFSEFRMKGDFCHIITTEEKKYAYCTKGSKSILITIAQVSCPDVELRVYTEHLANKVESILEGNYNIDLNIPQIIRSLAKTKSGELPKGHFSIKVIMTGNPQAGKTSIVNRFLEKEFQDIKFSTIGLDISEKLMEINNDTKITFTIWDIGGQITHMAPYRNKFYGGANAAFIIIDRTRSDHLKSVEAWYNDIKKYVGKELDIIIVGNKSDLVNDVFVQETDLRKLTDQFGFHYILTSAKTGENVKEAFLYIVYKFFETL